MRKIFLALWASAAIGLWTGPPGLADPGVQIKIQSFHLGQEKTFANGVWVSKPRALDENIIFLLQTNHIQNMEDYSQWLQENIAYRKDSDIENWRDPKKTLAQRYGDCKNFSFLTAAVLRVAGFEPMVMVCWRRGQGHMICVFQADGNYYWFDNAVLKKTAATSLPDFSREMVQSYQLSSFIELDTQNNRREIIYAL